MEQIQTLFAVLITFFVHFLVFTDSKCPPGQAALYKLTFHGQWSKKVFYKHYPMYRPPAQWSKIIGEMLNINNYTNNYINNNK